MSNEYRINHYVPVWYQKLFLPLGQINKELYYLHIKPENFIDSRGISHHKKSLYRQGFRRCFAETDLYTRRFSSKIHRDIEQYFFGEIDSKAPSAIDYFADFTHPSINNEAFYSLMMYMSTQKLRTLKGLGMISEQISTSNHNQILNYMLKLKELYCAIWSECVWQIADASKSDTKFIISDHPVTIYNKRCGPRSQWCRGYKDPDIRFHGSHTIFPLSLNKILILTNLSWARNPYQDPISMRPNPRFFRDTIFKYHDIQTLRFLNEHEVREINFVIKSRALRYIAAAKENWLYPEKYISKSNWNTYGGGYLFMPDPRPIHVGGQVFLGYEGGRTDAFDAYGRKPWDPEFNQEFEERRESATLYQFKSDFANKFGPYRRGRTFNGIHLDPEKDSDDIHEYYLGLGKKR